MIPLKSKADLEMLKESGRILAKIMRGLCTFIEAGVETAEVDRIAEELIKTENVMPAFKGYKGFPASVCASVNEEVVHGVPSARRLEAGDIVSLDIGINYKGYFSDLAVTVTVGRVDRRVRKLVDVTRAALFEGIKKARAENRLSDISYAVQNYVEQNGFSVVREFVGHGIGHKLHEEPEIPNFGMPRQGPQLKSGMVFAIEPMVNMGGWETRISDNGWTAVTKDGLPSAHFEHTIAITEKGPEILTN